MSDIIKHTDIAEVGVMKPFQDELLATIRILNTMDVDLVNIAKDIQKAFANKDTSTASGLKNIADNAKLANAVLEEANRISRERVKVAAQLGASVEHTANKLAEERLELERNNKANKENAKLHSETTGAYEKLSIQLNRTRKLWKDLAAVGQENTEGAKKLKKELDALDGTLKRIDASAGQHQRSVGNYASGFQGLRHSINQLTREAPAFANSFQTGFMALSNNIPIFVDEIAKLTAANKELNAQGEKTPSVFKSILTSFLSWQTALSVGVTLLTIYGAKIVESIGSLFGWKSATKKQEEAQALLNKQLEETIKKTNSLLQNQKDQIEFNTDALVIQAKLRGASQAEIDAITSKGRADEIRKTEEHVEKITSVWFHHWSALQEAQRKFDDDDSEENKKALDAAIEREKKAADEKDQADAQLKRAISKNALELRTDELEQAKEKAEADKQAAEEEKQRKLQALDLQHQINQAELNAQDQGIIIKQAQIMEDLKYQQAVNEIIINDKKKMHELNLALEKEARKKIQDLDDSLNDGYSPTSAPSPIKQDKILAGIKKQSKKLADEKEKARKEELKQEQALVNASVKVIESGLKRREEAEARSIEKSVNAQQSRVDRMRDLAQKESQSYEENLAFEQRKEAELEAKKDRLARKQFRREMFVAAAKMLGNNAGNPGQTLGTITSVLNSLPSFKEGIEDTGTDGSGPDGEFLAKLHKNERVVDEKNNKPLLDAGIKNDELPNLAKIYTILKPTSFDKVPMSNAYHDDQAVNEIRELNKKMDEAVNAIKNRPVPHTEFDEVSKLIKHVVETQYKTETIYKKPKLGGRRG